MTFTYRPEIDGLRAIAVLGVLLFHLGYETFSGGYVGVDVFFVISGYLITSIILATKKENRFSILDFYLKRIARLAPALSVTTLLTLSAGYLLFSPDDFARLGQSAKSAILAYSNIFFFLEAGYFDSQLSAKPLLHTWTLSLEWQFYAIWPLVLLAAYKITKGKRLLLILSLLSLTSFISLQLIMKENPEAAFYLLPFRTFEFTLGGIVSIATANRENIGKGIFFKLLQPISILLIILPFFFFSDKTAFPGLWVLAPVLGAALFIYSADKDSILAKKPFVIMGKLSYSIYLVHWPLITFYSYWIYRPTTNIEMATLGVISIALAIPMYLLVEKPFRINGAIKRTSRKNFAKVVACALVTTLPFSSGVAIEESQGYPERINNDFEKSFFGHLPCGTEGVRSSLTMTVCDFGENRSGEILLIGDSHSRHFAFGLSQSSIAEDYKVTSIFSGSCIPFENRQVVRNGVVDLACTEAKAAIEDAIDDEKYDLVIFSARWIGYTPRITRDELVNLQERVGETPLAIIGPTPYPRNQRPCDRPDFLSESTCGSFFPIEEDIEENNRLLSITEDLPATYIDLIDLGCGFNGCPFYSSNIAIYADTNHVSKAGSELYTSLFEDVLTTMTPTSSNRN